MSRLLSDIRNHTHHGHVVAVAVLLAPIVTVIAPLGLAPILGVSAVALTGLRRVRTGIWLSRPNSVIIVVGVLLAWVLASYFWSVDANGFADKIPRFLGIIIAGAVFFDGASDLNYDGRRLARKMLIIGCVVGVSLVFIERISDASFHRIVFGAPPSENVAFFTFNRAVTALSLMIWPVVLIVWRQRPVLALVLWTVNFAVIVSFESNAAIVGLLIGAGLFALVFWSPRKATATIGLILATLILISPLLPSLLPEQSVVKQHKETITDSGYHRLLIWKFVGEKIAERPLLGWGFNTSRSIPGGNRVLDIGAIALPLHPHNTSLQLWLELGLPGAALGAVLIAGVMFRISRMATARADKAASTGLVLGVMTIANLSYGAWQTWWLAAIWLAASFMTVSIKRTGAEFD